MMAASASSNGRSSTAAIPAGRERWADPRRVSLVITARNEPAHLLATTLDGLRATAAGFDHEILVLDDGSDKRIPPVGPEVRVVRNEPALGVSRSLRRGFELSTGDVLVALDAHMTFEPDWLAEMLSVLDDRTLLCPAALSYDLATPYYCGARMTWRDDSLPGLGYEPLPGRPDDTQVEVPMVLGACYMAERKTLERLGGLNPLLRVWGLLEQDLSLRAWACGLRVASAPRAGVGHYYRDTALNPVGEENHAFNRRLVVGSIFEDDIAALLLEHLPTPPHVRAWLDDGAVDEWRRDVQSRRRVGDRELLSGPLRALGETLPIDLGPPSRYRRGRWPRSVAVEHVRRDLVTLSVELAVTDRSRAVDAHEPDPPDEPGMVRLRACAVVWEGRALVLLDDPAGVAAAVQLALMRAGAWFLSGPWTVVDGTAAAHPSGGPSWDGGVNGRRPAEPCPVGWVVPLRWEAPEGCEVQRVSDGEAILALIGSVPEAEQRRQALDVLRGVAEAASPFRVALGTASEAAEAILAEIVRACHGSEGAGPRSSGRDVVTSDALRGGSSRDVMTVPGPTLALVGYGASVAVRTADLDLLAVLGDRIPPGMSVTASPECGGGPPGRWVDVERIGPSRWCLRVDGLESHQASNFDELVGVAESAWHSAIAELATEAVFVHAGVVSWRERLVVIPGPSFTGKSTLVAALVARGCVYYSDEFAVALPDGRVAPFPRRISLRTEKGTVCTRVPVEALGGQAGTEPRAVAMVLSTHYRPGRVWCPEPRSPGQAVMGLLLNTVAARRQPATTMRIASRVVSGALLLQGPRGEAEATADAVLARVEQSLEASA
jgi:glycosyltransferase involved in cell wall biosynthesis